MLLENFVFNMGVHILIFFLTVLSYIMKTGVKFFLSISNCLTFKCKLNAFGNSRLWA